MDYDKRFQSVIAIRREMHMWLPSLSKKWDHIFSAT
jgi:hypothetical protein